MSKELKIAKHLKAKLDKLCCPYTEDLDVEYILDVLMKPGDARIRILDWLYGRLDPSLGELLDSNTVPTTQHKIGSIVRKLLYVTSVLGLCHEDDVDLIKGVTGGSKQHAFLERLLDLVCTVDSSENIRARGLHSPGTVSEVMSLGEQVSYDMAYIDTLARNENMSSLFSTRVALLPPDLQRDVETHWIEQGLDFKAKPPLPSWKHLEEMSAELLEKMNKQSNILVKLQDSSEFHAIEDQGELNAVSHSLRLALSEMAQLMTGFSFSFEHDIRPWCNRTPPTLTELGPTMKRVHALFDQFLQLLTSLSTIKAAFTCLISAESVSNMSDHQALLRNADETGRLFLEHCDQCASILDKSLQQREHLLQMTFSDLINGSLAGHT